MNHTTTTTYAIRVGGHLDDHWWAWLGELNLTRNDDGSTTITAAVADQAQLHGVLARLRDIGAVLTEIRTTGAPPDQSAGARAPPAHRTPHAAPCRGRGRRCDLGVPPTRVSQRMAHRLSRRPRRLPHVVLRARTSREHCRRHPRPRRRSPDHRRLHAPREDAWAQLEVADHARGRQAELGWVLSPAYTGHGYATEAVRELIRYCFQDLGVRRVTANCFRDNDTSQRLMERIGMRLELHAVRESLHRSGRWLDTLGYAVLDEEWPPS